MLDLESELRESLADVANLVPMSPDPLGDYQQRSSRHSRQLRRVPLSVSVAAIVAATVAIAFGAVALESGGGGQRLTPTGSKAFALTPRTPISASALTKSATVIRNRLFGFGLKQVEVTAGEGVLVAQAPAAARRTLAEVAASEGNLRFRQTLGETAGGPATGVLAPPGIGSAQAAESATLTPAFLKIYAAWDCTAPGKGNPTRGTDLAADYIIACSTDGSTKYLLAPTAVDGGQVAHADAEFSSAHVWLVELRFRANGSTAWQQLTKRAYDVSNGQPSSATTPCVLPIGCNSVAMVLDGNVVSAPYISQAGGIAGGTAQIEGGLTQRSATRLADLIRYGALPTTFTVGLP